MPDTASRVREILAEHFGRPVEEITDATTLAGDLGADSLDPIEFAMTLEDEIGISIDMHAEQRWETVGDVVEAVRRLMPVGRDDGPTAA